MSKLALDDNELRKLPLEERVSKLEYIFKNSDDESARWDAVWLAGEIPVEVGLKGPLFDRAADLFGWVLKNDNNAVVRHEVCYQIAGRNMRDKIPDLAEASLHDKSDDFWYNKAVHYCEIGEYEEAKNALEKNLELNKKI